MSKTLIIVESPAKCKKIESYLGSNYKVVASYGHFTKLDDLKQIDFNNYQIKYKIDKSKVLKNIKDEIKKSKEVIIATDDDREGEAIGWTLCIFCKLDLNKTKKIVFQEITKSALQNALKNPRPINMNIVKSQQTRQILDIVLGYKVSPMLWKYVEHKLSAGRCQTPALKLIYDNQCEIDNLDYETHYSIILNLTSKNLKFVCNKNIIKENIELFLKNIKEQKHWILKDCIEKTKNEAPPKILITSTLQQKAHNILKFSPKQTMKYAQELYENGYITYMRTDSACYSKEFIETLKEHIIKNHSSKYLNPLIDELNKNKNKNKAQEAHEGIRVCDLTKNECTLENNSVKRLYAFIYKHTIQCGMSNAVYNEKRYNTILEKDKIEFYYINSVCLFKGWKVLETEKEDKDYSTYLNQLYNAKNSLTFNHLIANETLISNLLHYNEASIVQKLEKMNIGRPSTFSSIIQNLFDKHYVEKKNINGKEIDVINYIINKDKVLETNNEKKTLNNEKNKLEITPLGKSVCKFCYENFDSMFNYDFTNEMETFLDEIENGNTLQKEVLDDYIFKLNELIDNTKSKLTSNPELVKKVKDTSLHCGKYKNEPMYIKNGKFGYYLCIGKKDKISMKEFNGFNIEEKINNQEELSQEEQSKIINYIENRKTTNNPNLMIELNNDYSIRKSQYGYYVFYKTKSMKQPKFLKYNDEKDEKKEERNSWIEDKKIENIKEYLNLKYNINFTPLEFSNEH